jgi:hypothetical protein
LFGYGTRAIGEHMKHAMNSRVVAVSPVHEAAAERRALVGLAQLEREFMPFEWPPIEGDIPRLHDRVWTPALIRAWEECLDFARRSGGVDSMVVCSLSDGNVSERVSRHQGNSVGCHRTPLPIVF